MKLYKRILSILCVAGMIVSSLPFTAMATGDDGTVQPAASGQTVEVSGSIVWKTRTNNRFRPLYPLPCMQTVKPRKQNRP